MYTRRDVNTNTNIQVCSVCGVSRACDAGRVASHALDCRVHTAYYSNARGAWRCCGQHSLTDAGCLAAEHDFVTRRVGSDSSRRQRVWHGARSCFRRVDLQNVRGDADVDRTYMLREFGVDTQSRYVVVRSLSDEETVHAWWFASKDPELQTPLVCTPLELLGAQSCAAQSVRARREDPLQPPDTLVGGASKKRRLANPYLLMCTVATRDAPLVDERRVKRQRCDSV